MGLLDLVLHRRRQQRHMMSLTKELCQACCGQVWNRVRGHVFDMDLPEARGYICARALAPVRAQMTVMQARHGVMTVAVRQQLLRQTTERVVHAIVCDLVAGGPVARRVAA